MNTISESSETLQRKLKTKTGGIYGSDRVSPRDPLRVQEIKRAEGSYLLKSEEDVEKIEAANYVGVNILTPHKHVIGEIHKNSRFKEAVDDWSWGAPRMAEKLTSHPRMGASPQERVAREDKNEPEYQAMPLENTVAKQLFEIDLAIYILNMIREIKEGKTKRSDDDEKSEEKYDKMEKISKTYIPSFISALPGLMRIKDSLKIYKQNSPGYFARRFRNEPAHPGLPEVTSFLNIKNKRVLFERVKGHKDVSSFYKDLNRLMAVITTMKTACLAIIKGEDRDGYDVYNDYNNPDKNDAMSKANALRERYMAKNIANLPVPSMVKIGRGHITGLRDKPITDAKFYEDYDEFEVAQQANEVLR
ncbi:hypothetical protein LOZ80_06410 [Paenibacillus sp. HWE-109]|uniref:hypothetical protein n=1 Tax=Paenibacillus sp. HWE-109 TaxID=1306526 RepID=UPI001EDE044C|nr:hypothetical protein [Paenibacillus sp. HWE-109]UKS28554.1 hypothetical protein LOZ80_06410 [Paenibacillus sp. HWE-109]